ncbi:hypothetical protein ON064_12160, partial [Planococcus sp. A6]|uniref:hypothetical protein n=1 Tax=Planococcus sp. A6 TaxID=2992760 RepID=UPI00237A9C75
HAADATGRRVFSCPGMGRVLSQGGKKRATFVSPARSVPQASPLSLRLLVLECKVSYLSHSAEGVEMHHILKLDSTRSENEVASVFNR